MQTRQRQGQIIHRSLVRTPLVFGTELEVLAVEVAIVWPVVVVAGLSVLTLVVAGAFWMCVHPVMVWVTKQDSQVFRLYLRSLSHQSYYPAHALQRARAATYFNRMPGR